MKIKLNSKSHKYYEYIGINATSRSNTIEVHNLVAYSMDFSPIDRWIYHLIDQINNQAQHAHFRKRTGAVEHYLGGRGPARKRCFE